jgi:hypothetical protein
VDFVASLARAMEECPMAQSVARDAEDFARLVLQTVERLGLDGDWVRARDAFDQAVADHPDHAFVARLKAKPARRVGVFEAAERLREAEFPQIERRKVGTGRNAPVMYRAGGPRPGLDLQLPYEVPASHPLLVRRRADTTARPKLVSARRAALTAASPSSPWRRRLLRRVSAAGGAIAPARWSVRLWWTRLRAAVSAFAIGVRGR